MFLNAFKHNGEINHGEDKPHDNWLGFVLGLIEIAMFSILIGFGKFELIGAWLVLKTVPGWKRWGKDRNVYTRFLIGNGLVIILSFILANWILL